MRATVVRKQMQGFLPHLYVISGQKPESRARESVMVIAASVRRDTNEKGTRNRHYDKKPATRHNEAAPAGTRVPRPNFFIFRFAPFLLVTLTGGSLPE